MRIVEINATYNIGSTGFVVRDIGNILEKLGHEVFYAYQYASIKPQNGIIIGNILDWKLHAILCRLFGGQGFYSWLTTVLFIFKIMKIKPDIVHLHNLHSNFINLPVLFKYLSKHNIPTVVTLHDCWFFTGKCFHYVDVNCDKFMKKCGSCPKRFFSPKSIFIDRSSKDLKLKKKLLSEIPHLVIVGCSKWIAEEAQKGFMKEMNLLHIHNGVDINIFRPRYTTLRNQLGIAESDFVILGMANKWMQARNFAIFQCLLNQIPDIKIIILGCNDLEKQKLKNISKSIYAVGFISERILLAEYYSMSNVFVNLTHADTLPTVNMESICCGTPVITYNVGGSAELVDSNTGIVVDEDDFDGIIKAALHIKSFPLDNCSQVGFAKFSNQACYEKYNRIFMELNKSRFS